MATILKCKICGGDIEVSQNMTVGTCLYCGSTMTLPRIDSEKKARLFNRANEYRLNNEFDKAYDAYNAIVEEDEQEAEAYWGMVLSEYGVEYVEDPHTKKRIPTCHRTHIKSIQSTSNYEFACKYADAESRFMYQDEAEELDRIQKSILSISSKEDPYDVFICYKETDGQSGERTPDSVLAQDIYEALTSQGIRVFFSRISLAEKLGKDYEPYIFAALNSARVMIVVTSSNENVNSVWVKNEWSRFLHFMSDDHQKVIIPAFTDMVAYELPDELARFQSQDMTKVGALQDLTYSVKKLVSSGDRDAKDLALENLIQKSIEKEKRKSELVNNVAKAKNTFRKNIKYILAGILVLILFFVGIHFYKTLYVPFSTYKNGLKQIQVGEYDAAIDTFRGLGDYKDSKTQILEAKYQQANSLYSQGELDKALSKYIELKDYKDSASFITQIYYDQAYNLMESGEYGKAKVKFSELGDYSDSPEQMKECDYRRAVFYFENKSYREASGIFEQIRDYRDSNDLYLESKYNLAEDRTGDAAMSLYYELSLENYKDSQNKLNELAEPQYVTANELYTKHDYDKALVIYTLLAQYDYKESTDLVKKLEAEKNQVLAEAASKTMGTWKKGDETLVIQEKTVIYRGGFFKSNKNLGNWSYDPVMEQYRVSQLYWTISGNSLYLSNGGGFDPNNGQYTKVLD